MDISRGNELVDYKLGNLRISSSFRTSKTDNQNNCSYSFDLGSISMLSNVKKLDLNSVSICNNFNNVPSYANYFVLQWFDGVLHEVDVVVPPNYYAYDALATQLQTQIRAIDASLSAFTFVFDTTIQKFVFASGNPAVGVGFAPSVKVPNLENNNFLYLIGANPLGTGLSLGDPLTYRPALFGAVVVYIGSNRLGSGLSTKSQIIDDSVNRKVIALNSNEILALQITSEFGFYTHYYDQGSASRAKVSFQLPQQVTQFDISIQDAYGNIMESNDNNAPYFMNFGVYY